MRDLFSTPFMSPLGAGGVSLCAHAILALTLGGHVQRAFEQPAAPEAAAELLDAPSVEPAPAASDPPSAVSVAGRPRAHVHDYPVPPGHDRPHSPSEVHAPMLAAAPPVEPMPPVPMGSAAPSAAADSPPRFALAPVVGGARGDTGGGGGGPGETLSEREVNVAARVIQLSPALYPAEARDAEVEMDVPVLIVVDRNGQVVEAQAVGRHGYGLDEAATATIRSYRFSPATRNGTAVRVRMRWMVQFRLR